jgi:hypothetical protein
MKLSSLSYIRNGLMSILVLSAMLSPLFQLAFAPEPTKVYVDPMFVTGLPPGTPFDVNIRISEAVNVYTWGFELSFAKRMEVLKVVAIVEGDFLKMGGATGFTDYVDHANGLAKAAATLLMEVPGVSGNGILATITFQVVGGGSSDLDLHDTVLIDSSQNTLHPVEEDGYFIGTYPYASFTYAPLAPMVNEPVTFDAWPSYDPDGVIDSYYWDFDDGSTKNTADPIVTHTFTQTGTYDVNLTVTDDVGQSSSYVKPLMIWGFIVISDVKVTPSSIERGPSAPYLVEINVTVQNVAAYASTCNVTVYYNNTFLGMKTVGGLSLGRTNTTSFIWDTTGLPTGTAVINATVTSTHLDGRPTYNERTTNFTINPPSGKPEVYVYPSDVTFDPSLYPDGTFTVYVNITEAIDVYAWEFSFGWTASLLNFVKVEEGDFLKSQRTTSFSYTLYEDEVGVDYVLVTCTVVGLYQGVYGDGNLAAITLKAQGKGDTSLDLFNTELFDQANQPIDHTVTDGFFSNSFEVHDIQVVSLAVPTIPVIGQSYWLNATVSNKGIYSETNVEIRILINGTQEASTTIPVLAVGESYTFRYNWTATVGGITNVTAYAPPVLGETKITNNYMTKFMGMTEMQVYPSYVTFNPSLYPDGTFIVDVEISDATNVYAWEFSFGWTASMLNFVKVEEGNFLKGQPEGTVFFYQIFEDETGIDYILVNCTTKGAYPGVSGSGTLAKITLRVQAKGDTDLDLYDTTLWNQTLNVIDHFSTDGSFTNTFEVHDLQITSLEVPTSPIMGESYWLNATVSNKGIYSETNVEIRILINGTVVAAQIISELPPGQSNTLKYLWTPTIEGKYNITAYAPPVLGETAITKNRMTKWPVIVPKVRVEPPFTVTIYSATFKVVIETDETTTIQNFSFNYNAKQIRFEVKGKKDKTSFCKVTIPQNLMNVTVVKLNETATGYTLTNNATHYFVYFKYTFKSLYNVAIEGTWVNTPPQASFTPSTTKATKMKPVTFDATASADPDANGRIMQYFFDFNDGVMPKGTAKGTPNYDAVTGNLINFTWILTDRRGTSTRFNTTQPAIEYTYELEKYGVSNYYNVALTVTDKDGLETTFYKKIEVFGEYDLAIVDMTVDPTTANIGQYVSIDFKISYKLIPQAGLTANLTLYVNNTAWSRKTLEIGYPDSGTEKTEQLKWNTTGVTLGKYRINATITVTHIGKGTDPPPIPVSNYPLPEANTTDNTQVYSVLIKKWDSSLTIVVPSSLTVRTSSKISGFLSPKIAQADVTIQFRLGTPGSWNNATAKTGANGMYSYTWEPDTVGTYYIRASWLGNDITSGNMSAVRTVTVSKRVSTLSLDVSLDSVNVGSPVVLSGKVTPETVGVQVSIFVSKDGGEWTLLPQTDVTDSQGNYSVEWTPTEAGTYEVQAKWQGDDITERSESDVKIVQVQAAGFQDLYIYAGVGAIIILATLLAVYFLKKRKT